MAEHVGNAHSVQVRTKYEPVQKGDAPKEAGASHRFANVLVWEDE